MATFLIALFLFLTISFNSIIADLKINTKNIDISVC